MRQPHQFGKLLLRHAGLQRMIGSGVGGEGDVRSQPHQGNFVIALDHAAAGRHRSRADDLQRRQRHADVVAEDERRLLLDAELAALHTEFGHSLLHAGVGILVLLPGAHVGFLAEWSPRKLLTRAVFFECRADKERIALGRQEHAEEAFAHPPVRSAVIRERAAIGDRDRLQAVLAHELPGALHAGAHLVGADGNGLALARFQRGDRRRKLGWLGLRCL